MSKRASALEEKIMIVKALENGTHTISELEFIYNVRGVTIYDGYIDIKNMELKD